MANEKPSEPTPGYEELEDVEDWRSRCPNCGGSGLEWEGWPCDYCEGYGYLDI